MNFEKSVFWPKIPLQKPQKCPNFDPRTKFLNARYYRDSWLFDGQQFVQNNFQVDKQTPMVTENSTIIYKEETGSRMVSITVKLSIEKPEPGFYAIYSKITDAFGQPYYTRVGRFLKKVCFLLKSGKGHARRDQRLRFY